MISDTPFFSPWSDAPSRPPYELVFFSSLTGILLPEALSPFLPPPPPPPPCWVFVVFFLVVERFKPLMIAWGFLFFCSFCCSSTTPTHFFFASPEIFLNPACCQPDSSRTFFLDPPRPRPLLVPRRGPTSETRTARTVPESRSVTDFDHSIKSVQRR